MNREPDQIDDFNDEDETPSKSQIKREMLALRELGVRITELPRAQRDAIPRSERLSRALEEFDRIKSREARRRHMSFIGKVLRTEDLDAIEATMESFDAASARHNRTLHALETWRDALIASDGALNEFLDRWPDTDRPRLRNALRAARREAEASTEEAPQRRRFRELFQLLREETETGATLVPPAPRD